MASYSSVQYVADNNLMVGIGENIFEPNANLTRGMFVTILGRMAGINAAAYTTSAFTDVKVGAWYTPYVSWAASESIITGYGDSYFGVDDPITREQMATIIARYLSAAGITLSPSDDAVSSFRDAGVCIQPGSGGTGTDAADGNYCWGGSGKLQSRKYSDPCAGGNNFYASGTGD